MKEKVESGEIPAAAVQQMQKNGQSKVDVKQATFKTIVNKVQVCKQLPLLVTYLMEWVII